MEKNLSIYITKLIELDSKAVDFKDKRDSELASLEAGSRNELSSIEGILGETAAEARREYDRTIGEARQQAQKITEAAGLKMDEIEAHFASIREDAARDIWKQLLEIER
ncbi:MAG TPA: hypothetical protein VN580_06710 [Clostridia bacterium]|nr:hypothetical protein [Clostridia bacterium]